MQCRYSGATAPLENFYSATKAQLQHRYFRTATAPLQRCYSFARELLQI
jgi:hypothetical protein